MKSLIIIFGAMLLIIATPFVWNAIDNAQSESATQSFAGVSTGAGEYAANVTLTTAPRNNSYLSVSAVSSNSSADAPTAANFTTVNRALQINGLEQSTIRVLSVTYLVDSTALPGGMGSFLTVLRWFWAFIVIGTFGGAVYAFFD